MKITSFIHPQRTVVPCTGVGRHINNILLRLNEAPGINLELLVAKEWLEKTGRLSPKMPLSKVDTASFPFPENLTERLWKMTNWPKMDRWVGDADWVYSPAETFVPLRKTRLAVTIHDVQAFETDLPWSDTAEHQLFRRKWSVWIYKVLQKATLIFTVSEYSRQRMIELLGADPDKIVVVGNGVEDSYFEKHSEKVNQPHVLVIGGLRYKKGGEAVLAVAKALEKRNSPLKIITVGQNDEELLGRAAALSNLEVRGMAEEEELLRLLRSASSLLFLSYYEGFGIPALEAMAAGVPALVSNRASLPEIVGNAGIIKDPEQHQEIAALLDEFHNNDNFRLEYSQKGKAHAAAYTWEACTQRVIEAFKRY